MGTSLARFNFDDESFDAEVLSNQELIEQINFIDNKLNFLYSQELSRLERKKSEAIITNILEFKELSEQYLNTKSISPEIWLQSWEIYSSLLQEAEKRNIPLKRNKKIF